MSCERCNGIHIAQESGLTQLECRCGCHNNFTNNISTSGNFVYNPSTEESRGA